MRMRVLIVGAMALGACADKTDTTPDGVKFQVAPLTLPGITNACYTLTVENADGDVVWTKSNICADDYGDAGGSITYIGPCDASADQQNNYVRLELEDLFESDGTTGLTDQFSGAENPDFNNPCPTQGDIDGAGSGTVGCTLDFECIENADVSVVFNISLMRSAKQGFFDIAVNFEDIFCSAKVDCQDELLFVDDGNGGLVRGPTAILAFACTAGENANTSLWLSNVNISCDGNNNGTFDPTAGEGQHDGNGVGETFAVYQGAEQLGDYNKLYWNMAIAVPGTLTGSCYLNATGTAAENTSGLTPANTTSPFVDFHVLLNPDGSSNLSCENNPLNGFLADGETASGVNTVYDDVASQKCFAHYLSRGANFTAVEGDTGCNQ